MAGKDRRALTEKMRGLTDRDLLFVLLLELRRNTNALERLNLETANLAKKSASVGDALTQLQADVAAETTVDQSVLTLLAGIPAQIAAAVAAATAAGATPDQLAAFDTLATSIETNSTSLAAAVTANTPAAPSDPGTGTGTDPGTGDAGTPPAGTTGGTSTG